MSDSEMYEQLSGDMQMVGWAACTSTGDVFFHSSLYPNVKLLVLHLETGVTQEQAAILAERIHDRFDGTGALFDPDPSSGGRRKAA